jgi:hypothetical protein
VSELTESLWRNLTPYTSMDRLMSQDVAISGRLFRNYREALTKTAKDGPSLHRTGALEQDISTLPQSTSDMHISRIQFSREFLQTLTKTSYDT